MKNYFFGLLTGLIIVGIAGFMLFDNYKVKLRVAAIEQFINSAVQQSQRQARITPPIQQEKK